MPQVNACLVGVMRQVTLAAVQPSCDSSKFLLYFHIHPGSFCCHFLFYFEMLPLCFLLLLYLCLLLLSCPPLSCQSMCDIFPWWPAVGSDTVEPVSTSCCRTEPLASFNGLNFLTCWGSVKSQPYIKKTQPWLKMDASRKTALYELWDIKRGEGERGGVLDQVRTYDFTGRQDFFWFFFCPDPKTIWESEAECVASTLW